MGERLLFGPFYMDSRLAKIVAQRCLTIQSGATPIRGIDDDARSLRLLHPGVRGSRIPDLLEDSPPIGLSAPRVTSLVC